MNDAIQAITMPKWGLSMEEGVVVAWLVEVGGSIERGQEILEIETTKITNVYEAPAPGTLRRQVVAEGDTVPVGSLLGLLAGPSVADADLDAFIERFNADFAVSAADASAAAPEPETVKVGDFNLNYLRMGANTGIPVVLVHGFGGDLNNWLFNQPALAEDQDVLALDLPGHGRSSKYLATADIVMLTGAFRDFLDAVGIAQAQIVGHSMGGAVALSFAAENPERVHGLTLLAPGGLGPEINMEFIDGFIAAGRRKEMRSALESLVADPDLISRDMINDVLKYKRLDGVEQALRSLANGLFPNGRQQVLDRGSLEKITAPISVIWGQSDQVIPADHADTLSDLAQVHRLEGVGHMPHMEAAAEINRLIAASVA